MGCLVNPIESELLNRQYDRRPPPPRPVIVCAADVPLRRRGEIAETFDYCDSNGALLYQSLRYKAWSRRGWRRPNGKGGWLYDLCGTPRVVYRLPELLAANPATWVFVVEREKDADALTALGLVATCNPGGAGNSRKRGGFLKPADRRAAVRAWGALSGRRICIIPCKDVAGWMWADDLAEKLAGTAAELRILALPGGCKSVAAWLQAQSKRKGSRTYGY